jgi:hypothetical protein
VNVEGASSEAPREAGSLTWRAQIRVPKLIPRSSLVADDVAGLTFWISSNAGSGERYDERLAETRFTASAQTAPVSRALVPRDVVPVRGSAPVDRPVFLALHPWDALRRAFALESQAGAHPRRAPRAAAGLRRHVAVAVPASPWCAVPASARTRWSAPHRTPPTRRGTRSRVPLRRAETRAGWPPSRRVR